MKDIEKKQNNSAFFLYGNTIFLYNKYSIDNSGGRDERKNKK